MIKLNIFLLLVLTSVLLSCTTEPTKVVPPPAVSKTLKFSLKNETFNSPELYAFWGDKQIFVDSLPVIQGNVVYNLSEKCRTGVYRIVSEGLVFDFVYDNENINVEVDLEKGYEGIKVLASESNKKYYDFLKTYIELEKAEKSCDRLTELNEIYNKNEVFVDKVIKFLLNTSLNCAENLHEESKGDWLEENILKNIKISNELMATPYLYSQLSNILNANGSINDQEFVELKENLLKNNVKDSILNHFIDALFFEDACIRKREGYFSSLYIFNKSCRLPEVKTYNLGNFFGLGEIIEDDLTSVQSLKKGENIILIVQKDCAADNDFGQMLTKRISKKQNVSYKVVDINNLDQLSKEKYNLYGTPSIFIVNEQGVLSERWSGPEESRSFYNLLEN